MQTEPDAKYSQVQRRVQSASVVSHNTAVHSERVLTFPPCPPSLWLGEVAAGLEGGGTRGKAGWLPLHGVGCSFWFGRNRFYINGVIPQLASCSRREGETVAVKWWPRATASHDGQNIEEVILIFKWFVFLFFKSKHKPGRWRRH